MKERIKMRVITVHQQTLTSAEALRLPCPVCAREVEMLSNTQAVRILDVDVETLGSLIRGGRVHALETISGSTWICKDSLLAKTDLEELRNGLAARLR